MEDKCPDLKGEVKNNGCPDRDFDGVYDNIDMCPDKAGPVKNNGCPDSDGDGLHDAIDDCPEQAGLVKFKGCPDRDLDNVADKNDKCPDTYGDPLNDGCPLVLIEVVDTVKKPELTFEEQNVLQKAFSNLEFPSGKITFSEASKPTLDALAIVLKKNTKYKLIISGHTDNVGNAATNLKLSKERAESVKRYLIGKGVSSKRLTSEGFGDTRPVSANDTEDGRQKNRRVELKITE
jgi:outer membrane protein OmpA-like peptidoglycan-associated protein